MDNGNGMDSFEQKWMQQPAFPAQSMEMPPQERSGIPKVIGILMIIFASLGLFWSIVSLLRTMMVASAFGGGAAGGIFLMFSLVDLAVGVLHLTAGLRAISYKESAIRLAMMYGWIKIVMTIGSLIIVYAVIGSHGDGALMAPIFAIVGIIALAWPIVVLALMSRPSARASCVNF